MILNILFNYKNIFFPFYFLCKKVEELKQVDQTMFFFNQMDNLNSRRPCEVKQQIRLRQAICLHHKGHTTFFYLIGHSHVRRDSDEPFYILKTNLETELELGGSVDGLEAVGALRGARVEVLHQTIPIGISKFVSCICYLFFKISY